MEKLSKDVSHSSSAMFCSCLRFLVFRDANLFYDFFFLFLENCFFLLFSRNPLDSAASTIWIASHMCSVKLTNYWCTLWVHFMGGVWIVEFFGNGKNLFHLFYFICWTIGTCLISIYFSCSPAHLTYQRQDSFWQMFYDPWESLQCEWRE
jgi:hypothetical protein